MKKLEFETSKGRFLVNEEGKGISLKEISEEQASEIVDYSILKKMYASYNYGFSTNSYVYKTAIESLHSLLKSEGIHLFENPFYHGDLEDYAKYKDAEQKTFHNPYIFKLLQY